MVWACPIVRVRPRGTGRPGVLRDVLGAGLQELGQAEIEKLGVPLPSDHDVVRLDVPVDDVRFVRLGQAFGDLEGDLHRAEEVQLAVGDEPVDGPSVHIFHGDERRPVVLVDVIDLGDGGMGDGRRGAGLAQEPGLAVRVRDELGLEEFQGHGPLEFGVQRPVDDAHAALAEHAFDFVLFQGLADHDVRLFPRDSCLADINTTGAGQGQTSGIKAAIKSKAIGIGQNSGKPRRQ